MCGDNGHNDQYGNPRGSEGRTILEGMNDHHMPLWEWCMSFMPKGMDGAVLDVGCGGGGFLRELSRKYPFAMFFGADISEDALSMTSESNAALIEEGGLELHMASVDDLPFDDGSFDLVTAMETYFFWPDPVSGIREVARVMSPGGLFVIGSEMQVRDDNLDRVEDAFRSYGARLLPDDTIAGMMDSAGFDVSVHSDPSRDWVVFVGTKRF